MNIVVFLGAPGPGKGTQAKKLAESHGFIHLSTGDMLRAAMAEGTELGKKAKAIIEKGELVSDEVMIGLIESTLASLPENSQILLDGFPRTLPQAQALDSGVKTKVNFALYFNMSDKLLVERLTGRRICEKCSEPFHVSFVPPKVEGKCDKCGGNLIQRKDDKTDVVAKRLQVYQQLTAPLLVYYRQNSRLREVEGDQPVEQLQKQILQSLR